jgi:hypothetical protein
VISDIVTKPTLGVTKEIASIFHGGKFQFISRSTHDFYRAFYFANPIHQARFDGVTNILGVGTPFQVTDRIIQLVTVDVIDTRE